MNAADMAFEVDAVSVCVAAGSDVGLRRARNEDSMLAEFPVFLVADGMGGHQHGEEASAAALAPFRALLTGDCADIEAVERLLPEVLLAVDSVTGGGTTLTGAVLVQSDALPYWYVVNIGDSRTYLVEHGRLQQVSVDHSVVQEYVDSGALSVEQAKTHPSRNVITRAIGVGSDHRFDAWMIPAERGQRLLVCSDGLSGVLSPEQMESTVLTDEPPGRVVGSLLEQTLAAGAPDNVTAMVIDVTSAVNSELPVESTGGIDEDTVPEGTVPESEF